MPIGSWAFCWTIMIIASCMAIAAMSEHGWSERNELVKLAVFTGGILVIGGIFLMWRP